MAPHNTGGEEVGAIIVAAGSARRMCGIDKAFALLLDVPLVAWSIRVLERCAAIHHIVLVVREDQVDAAHILARAEGWRKLRHVVAGGERRQDSVVRGMAALPAVQWLVIHDGARPLITEQLVVLCLEHAQETGAAIAATPITDTVKKVEQGSIVATIDRSQLWAAQTPQVFRRELLHGCLTQASQSALQMTDESSVVEKFGATVRVVPGDVRNVKVTFPEDLEYASWLLARTVAP